MTPTITVQTERFRQALRALLADTRKDGKAVLQSEARNFVGDVVRLTPPTGKSPFKENFGVQRAAGLNAIEGDVKRLYSRLDVLKVVTNPTDEKMGKAIRRYRAKGEWDKLQALLQSVLKNRGVRVFQNADPAFHRQNRNRRGRILGKDRPFFVQNHSTIKKLIVDLQKKVGYAKAGWMKAVIALKVPKIPIWIKKHAGAPGIYRAKLENTSEMSITVGNTVPYIQRSGRDLRIIERALGERVRSINIRLANAMRTRIAKANSGRRVA